jgi:uncharacterized protein YjcR
MSKELQQFRFIKEVEGKVGGYGGQQVATGDVIGLEPKWAKKAAKNPDYETYYPDETVMTDNGEGVMTDEQLEEATAP